MKKIRLLALLCLVVMLTVLICACGDDTSESTPDSSSVSTPASTPSSAQASTPTQDSKPADSTPTSTPVSTPTQDSTPTSTPVSTPSQDSTPASTPVSTPSQDSTPTDSTPASTPSAPITVDYKVRVQDYFGNTIDGIIVAVYKEADDSMIGQKFLTDGEASFTLEKAEYYFEITSMDSEIHYDDNECYFADDRTEVTVTVYGSVDTTSTERIFVPDKDDPNGVPFDAPSIGEGGTHVQITRQQGTYFIFTPTRGGIYQISYISNRALTFGYYGNPFNVLKDSAAEVVNKSFTVEVKNEGVNIGNQGGTTQLVIGVGSYASSDCIIVIERIGDATVELPFTVIQADKNATKKDNPLTSEFVDVDIKDKDLVVVYNEKDGYYHLGTEDGPLVYVRINTAIIKEQTDSETIYAYLPSFITMCETDRLCKYFYEDGKVVRKESYNDMFYEYEALCGTMGLYPLNKQLADAIKNIGEHKGWFDLDSQLHIFGEDVSLINPENAWLFACCYEVENAKGTETAPAFVEANSADKVVTYAINAQKGQNVVLRTIANATITILDASDISIVANDGTVYVEKIDGKLIVNIKANQNFTVIYNGESDSASVHFTFVQYTGTFE